MPRAAAGRRKPPENLFGNPGFEDGRDPWRMDRAGKTTARFAVDDKEAAAGRRSARLDASTPSTSGACSSARASRPIEQGKTYTFAVLGKSLKGPVTVRLEMERAAKPYDRAGASEPLTLPERPLDGASRHVPRRRSRSRKAGSPTSVAARPRPSSASTSSGCIKASTSRYEKAAQEEAEAVAVASVRYGHAGGCAACPARRSRSKTGWTKVPEDETDHRFARRRRAG